MSLNATHLSCIRQDRLIFKDISFSLKSGEVLWIKGKNGAGKSSLLRIIAGLLKPSDGDILWNATSIRDDRDDFQSNFRYIAHQDALKPAFTAIENLRFWSLFFGQDQVTDALKKFELEKIADVPAGIMSAGQKKRTNLARLIACPAPVWILDEPVSSLDSHYIDLFRQLLIHHVRGGGMVLLATHQDLVLDNVNILDLDKGQEN